MNNRIIEIVHKLNFFIPIVLYFALFLILVEAVIYPGFLSKYIFFNSKHIAFFSFLVSMFLVYFDNLKRNTITNTLFSLNYLMVPIFISSYFLLVIEENNNFPNYVFSVYHIHIAQIKAALFLSLGILFIDIFGKKIETLKRTFERYFLSDNKYLRLQNYLLVILVFTFVTFNSLSIIDLFISNYSDILSNPLISYEEKQNKKVPLYNFFQFIKNSTESNSTILIPPQESPWLTVGNEGFIRYFLYPRNLVKGKIDNNDLDNIDYIILAKGSWHVDDISQYGWPRESIDNVEILLYDNDNNETSSYHKNEYRYETNSELSKKWGLIKVIK